MLLVQGEEVRVAGLSIPKFGLKPVEDRGMEKRKRALHYSTTPARVAGFLTSVVTSS